ncbi:MAG: PEP-CTERM sorting domain-containing protein [Akkermansiaceae bacterium]
MKDIKTLIVTSSLMFCSVSSAVNVIYDWQPAGDQGLQGWTTIYSDPANASFTGYAFADYDDQLGSPQVASSQDAAHTTLLVESPEFGITATSAISFVLIEGQPQVALVSNFSDLPTTSSNTDGYIGLALQRVSDGAYLLDQGRTANGNSGNPQTFGWTSGDLATATAGDLATETYTLHLIDYKHGGWGHVGLESASLTDVIPVPEPSASMLGLLGMVAFLRRKR